MGNSYYQQFLYSKVRMLTMLEGTAVIGASGAVSSFTGSGIYSVSKLATGIYSVQVADNFNYFVSALFTKEGPPVGSAVTAGSFVTGVLYQITSLGNTNFISAGLPAGMTQAIGQTFVATGAGSGTGTATPIGQTGINYIELAVDPEKMLQTSIAGQGAVIQFQTLALSAAAFTGNTTNTSTSVASVSSYNGLAVGQSIMGAGIPLGATIAALTPGSSTLTLSAAATATATGVAMTASPASLLASPVSGSVIRFQLFFRNSSVAY